MKKIALLTSVALLVTGCNLTPDYERPKADLPDAFQRQLQTTAEITQAQKIPTDWWKNFRNDELNQLMDQALAQNNDIKAAVARIKQARAQEKIVGSALYPSLGASAAVTRDMSANSGSRLGTNGKSNRTSFTGGPDIAYEVDLFGKNRSSAEAAAADTQASIYDQESVRLLTLSETARAYFTVINLRERIALAQNNLKNSQEVLRIINARYEAGAASALDVAQQKTSVSNTEAALSSLVQQGANAEDALSVLVGTPVQNVKLIKADLNATVIPSIMPYQPSQLLERRPDIRTAESELVAANADIGAARAAYFPSLNLTSGVLLAASPLSAATTTAYSIGAAITAPIFSGGANEGGVELTKARKEELVEDYHKAILVSLEETEDALAAVKASSERNQSLKEGVEQARKAYELSRELYKSGAVDFQKLLDSERDLIQTEDTYAQTRLENLSAAIDLYKALGGGWSSDESQQVTVSEQEGTLVIEGAKQNAVIPPAQTPSAATPAVAAPVSTAAPAAPAQAVPLPVTTITQ